MGALYRLDFSNGKSYIGITTKTAQKRFNGHRLRVSSGVLDNTLMYNAWRKYGEPKLIILAILENHMLKETEIAAIKAYNTFAPNGYNTTPGGDFPPLLNPEIAKKLIGNKNAKGSKHERSKEYRNKLSIALKGNKNSLGNKHGIGNKNASGKRSEYQIHNIKMGIAKGKVKRFLIENGIKL